MEKDVVCGMEVAKTSEYKSAVKDKTYFFCSTECKAKFDANPIKYAR